MQNYVCHLAAVGASSLGGVGSWERGEMVRAGETQVERKVGASSLST